ncbi:MAG: nucleotidyltransferase domain-containing protein [Capnocytophaga sp.]|nr:nucleotidyltransferase domain-containing protein [Capnocytophaga sp.]
MNLDFSRLTHLPKDVTTAIIEFTENFIFCQWKPDCILFYGSYADNSYTAGSDIDMMIFVPDDCVTNAQMKILKFRCFNFFFNFVNSKIAFAR